MTDHGSATTRQSQQGCDVWQYRDEIRTATLKAAQHLASGSVDQVLPSILATLGDSFAADRIVILEHQSSGASAAAIPSHAWQRPSVPQLTPSSFGEYPLNTDEFRQWLQPLFSGQHILKTVREARGPFIDLFRMLEMKSLLIVPMMVDGKAWGAIGVDSCATERHWTPVEIDLMQIVANLIGITILRDRHMQRLQESEQKFRTLSETAQDAVIVVNSEGVVQYWNPSAERILGYPAAEALGWNVHEWIAPPRLRGHAALGTHQFAVAGQGCAIGKTRELQAVRKDGVEIPVELALASMQLNGEWCAVGVIRDISARKQTERRILWLARNDALTGLPNRLVFIEELNKAITQSRRTGKPFAVYYLDLDHFKDINDTLGHASGDLLLEKVAERLKQTVRPFDVVARFGGDEFAVLATDLADRTDAGIVAQKILSALAVPFVISGAEIHTSATIGIAVSGVSVSDAETLVGHADAALYHAKAQGKGMFRFFTQALDNEVRQRVTLLAELREGIAREELFLVYQPQVEMKTARVVGLEALVRWRHPVHGIVSPGQFIPAAENSGLIISLGRWVLHEACRQARIWLDAGLPVPVIAVNVSPTQFKSALDFGAEVAGILEASRLSAGQLEVELTETALMQASSRNSAIMQELRDLGVRIAIDDFGTGYSCLDYLRRFPASRIKIAQTFVNDIACNAGSAAITRAAIGLGRELGLSVIAEGVETIEQVTLLQQWGCHEAQGFHYARPLPSDQVPPLLVAGNVLRAMEAKA